MGISDLEFGWHNNRLSLSDVKINSRFELEAQDKDGEWIEFEPPSYLWLKTDEERETKNKKYEEALKTVRYSKPKRWLSAKWVIGNDVHSTPYLGIPENKETPSQKYDARIESINIVIHEVSDESVVHDNVGDIYCRGEIPTISLEATTSVFDDIEKMAGKPSVIFEIELQMMGWYWIGPIGDSEVYIDLENRHPVIFSGFIATKKYSEKEKEQLAENVSEVEYPRDYSQEGIETNMHLYNSLTVIKKVTASTNAAAWLATVGVLAIAVKMWA